MKTLLACATTAVLLTACGSDEKTTVIHERPVYVTPHTVPAPSPDSVEAQCKHGYDNRTRSCY